MRPQPFHASAHPRQAYALMLVLLFSGVSLTILAAAMRWASSNAILTQRNNQLASNGSVAEVATQKVIGMIAQDFTSNGESYVYSRLSTYQTTVPTIYESSSWADYQFSDGQGNLSRTYVDRIASRSFGSLQTKYTGMKGYGTTYRVLSNARNRVTEPTNVVSAVEQRIQVAEIPLFQFGIFYGGDLEICPSSSMTWNGQVHANGNIYLQPSSSTLTFQSHVTSAGTINLTKSPNDPTTTRSAGTVTFAASRDSGARSLSVPMGQPNDSWFAHNLIDPPDPGESATSMLGASRLYNQADLVILISNTTAVATSGAYNNFATSIPWSTFTGGSPILNTNVTFYDRREFYTTLTTQLDISRLVANYVTLTSLLGRQPKTIYIGDFRDTGNNYLDSIRLVNGSTLPSAGLTVVSPNPVYIQGHYNVPVAYQGTTNTSLSVPAAIFGDAITVLSPSWSDAQSTKTLSKRVATATTVNAALVAGNVASGYGYYSGGAENLIRLLEDWTSKTLTLNGSLACLYSSRSANMVYGYSSTVFLPPTTRAYAADPNFKSVALLPPSTPYLRTVLKASYARVAPGIIPP